MSTALLPIFRVLRHTEDGWVQAIDAEGEPVYKVGLDPSRSRAAAEETARELAEAEPDAVFVVVDPSGAEMYRASP